MSAVARQAVILAGGRGTRLGQRTADTPKFLLPVAGRPFAHWLLEALAAARLRQVVLCIGHLGQAIRAELGDGSRFGLELGYSEDGPRLLGTAGALRRAAGRLAPSFLVTYGDSYLPFDYAEPLRDLEAHPDALGTLAVYRNRDLYDRSNVRISGEWVAEYRKPARDAPPDPRFEDIDYGAMALRREAVLALDPDEPASLEHLQAELACRGQLRALRAERCFFEIGSEQGLARLERELSSRARGSAERPRPKGRLMIISRAPLRFSLGGGGSDLPGYCRTHGGFVVSAAIDQYVYVTANRRFYRDLRLAYSKTEIAKSADDVEHPIFREALRMAGIDQGIELTSVAELPANSGLGSSSTFTVALLNALHAYKRESVSSRQLAEEACTIEIDRLGAPIGKQDQYIAAFGNVTALTFEPDGTVHVEPVPVRDEVLDELESNLLIMYSGIERPASRVLVEQNAALGASGGQATEGMHRIKQIGHETYRLLCAGDVDRYGELLDEHWTRKRRQASVMSDPTLDEHYEAARKAGALGGKLMGAGGGGFFMFYVRPAERRRVLEALTARGLRQLRFRFDLDGARIVANLHRS